MKAGSTLKPSGIAGLIARRCLLLLVFAWLAGQPAIAQQQGQMSPSLVLVLKLVSATHVQPVTGIVVSGDGQVLVPAEFIAGVSGPQQAEIIVLDGGTDIIRHGRPARVVKDKANGAMALLAVEGLTRPGIMLSDNHGSAEYRLHLEAFPPASDIAEGADPLWIPLTGLPDAAVRETAASDATPLPYVTAAIMDSCGYLAAISLASGVQSLATGQATQIIDADGLRRVLDSLQIELPGAKCAVVPEQTPEATTGPEPGAQAGQDPDPAIPREEANPAAEGELPSEETQTTATESETGDPGQPVTGPRPAPQQLEGSPARELMSWLLVIGFIIAGVVLIRRIRPGKRDTAGATQADNGTHTQPASDEPDTVQLQACAEISAPRPRSGQSDRQTMPDINNLGEGNNAFVMLAGWLDSDTRFERYCEVDAEHINIVIGRGDADIGIEHPAVSRRHVSLQSSSGSMTLSDLGSSNGTFIRGVPCLPGEVMFIENEDEVFLGDVGFRIRLIASEAVLP